MDTGAATTQDFAARGAVYGIVAGLIFAVGEVVAAAAMGMPALMPIRMIAGIALGEAALAEVGLATALIVGVIVHVILSAAFGAVYGMLFSRMAPMVRASMPQQAVYGIAFGTALWLVNFQIIARAAFPWFLDVSQFVQWLLHALVFGLPLALLLSASVQRAAVIEEPRRRTAPPEGPPRPRPA